MKEPDLSWLSAEVAERYELLGLQTLIPIFHGFHNITKEEALRDSQEKRNLQVLRWLLPDNEFGFAGVLYKPPNFIHKFEAYYSLPGYLDLKVLPCFCRTTNELAKKQPPLSAPDFLAFVYMFFLLIHPLPECNGRVARSVLDYYNKKLKLNLKEVWNNRPPIYEKFSEDNRHRVAFKTFFEEAGLPARQRFCDDDPFPIPEALKTHLDRMAQYMIEWAESLKNRQECPGDRPHLRLMSDLICNAAGE